MQLYPLKSELIQPKKSLLTYLIPALQKAHKKLQNNDILVITSKVLALSQNRLTNLPIEQAVKAEADIYLSQQPCRLTIKDGLLIPGAGIDQSNSPTGTLILWPRNPWQAASKLRKQLLQKFKLKQLGLLITDSTSRPLRLGVNSLALAWSGFQGVRDVRGQKDLFDQKLRITQIACADALASSAGLLTGEANESTPFVLIRAAPVKFCAKTQRPKPLLPNECLYQSIYKPSFRKIKNLKRTD